MKMLKILFLGSALVVASSPGHAVPPPSHEMCMAIATATCHDNNNLGYPDFQQCGAAVYADCMGVNQGGPGGGSGMPPGIPDCHVAGRIDEGGITNPNDECKPPQW